MSPDYAAQREALVDLSVAYSNARDFTRQVLCTAFGNVALGSVPPPSECVWTPNIAHAEANSRLRAVQHFLSQSRDVFKDVLREIEDAQVRLVASDFDVPRSWFIIDPLDTIKGWYLGACGVEEIVRSAASEDSALETVVKEISIDVRKMKGRIAKAEQASGDGGPTTQAMKDETPSENGRPPHPVHESRTPADKSTAAFEAVPSERMPEAATGELESQPGLNPPTKSRGGWMGDVELATALAVHSSQVPAFRAKLRRMRESRELSMDDWQKFENRNRNEPQFLYRENAPAIVAMAKRYSFPK